jgi:hypothetical protein
VDELLNGCFGSQADYFTDITSTAASGAKAAPRSALEALISRNRAWMSGFTKSGRSLAEIIEDLKVC